MNPNDIAQRFIACLEYAVRLGIEVDSARQDWLRLSLKPNDWNVGNPETGVIHGGALTTLLDTACGACVLLSLPELELCPTLDLRVDYVKAASPDRAVYADATCYRISRHVVFTRAIAHQGNLDDPIAHGVATFVRLGLEVTPARFRDYLQGLREWK
jgi:uncharacterized protein (TIGR00369 family)